MGLPSRSFPADPTRSPTFPILDRRGVTEEELLELLFGEHDTAQCLVGLEFLEALILFILSKGVVAVRTIIHVFYFLPLSAHLIILLPLPITILSITCGLL